MKSSRRWIQNETADKAYYWRDVKHELPEHIFRKGYMVLWYDIESVEIGEPQSTPQYTVDELKERGIVGIYAIDRRK